MSPPLDPANPLLISKELLGSQEVSYCDDGDDDDYCDEFWVGDDNCDEFDDNDAG